MGKEDEAQTNPNLDEIQLKNNLNRMSIRTSKRITKKVGKTKDKPNPPIKGKIENPLGCHPTLPFRLREPFEAKRAVTLVKLPNYPQPLLLLPLKRIILKNQ